MSNLYNALSICVDEVQHYYRAMGGSNQYERFMNWHIPAFVLLTYQDKVGSEGLPYAIWDKTGDLQALVKSKLEGIEPAKKTLEEFVESVTNQISKFNDEREMVEWINFTREQKLRF